MERVRKWRTTRSLLCPLSRVRSAQTVILSNVIVSFHNNWQSTRLSHFEAAAAEFLAISLLRRLHVVPQRTSLCGDNSRWTLDDTRVRPVTAKDGFLDSANLIIELQL